MIMSYLEFYMLDSILSKTVNMNELNAMAAKYELI